MKIAFSGTGAVGKTTMAMDIAESFKIEYIPESVRKVYDLFFKYQQNSLENLPPDLREDFQLACISYQIGAQNEKDSFVTCRHISDFFIYCKWFEKNNRITTRVWPDLEDELMENTYYDLVIYTPPFDPSTFEDGVRFSCPGMRKDLDEMIRENLDYVRKFQPVLELKSLDYDSRICEITEFIRGLG